MTWTSHSYASGEVLTSSKMNEMQANFTAMAEGHSGAPKITTDALDAGVLRQSQMKSTTASGSYTATGNENFTYTLTGGSYSWWTATGGAAIFGSGDTATGVLGFWSNGTSAMYFYERYIQASPPYSFGAGDIPLFIFAKVNKDGTIGGVSVAPDPPWAYHGPTDIQPHRRDKLSKRAWRVINGLEVELTWQYKNSDMALYPHPFSAGSQVVILDPLTPVMGKLKDMLDQSHAAEIRKIIERHLKLKHVLDGLSPPGVPLYAFEI